MRPTAYREAVVYIQQEWQLSQRRACGIVTLNRASARYQARRSGDQELRERLRMLAGERKAVRLPEAAHHA